MHDDDAADPLYRRLWIAYLSLLTAAMIVGGIRYPSTEARWVVTTGLMFVAVSIGWVRIFTRRQ